MAWWVQPLEIADENGNPTGRFRMTATSDEDGGGPFGDTSHDHASAEEAQECVRCNEYCSRISGFPPRKERQISEPTETLTDDDILALWSGGSVGVTRPVLGSQKVLSFAHALLAIVSGANDEARLLGDLLAVIHRDGGHYTDRVGVEASAEEAKRIFFSLRDREPTEAQIDYRALYHDLLFAVGNKHAGETRHETALRCATSGKLNEVTVPHSRRGMRND